MNVSSESILLLVTGGTLDKAYDPLSGDLTFPSSHLPTLLKEARCTLPLEVDVLMQKDSLQMDANDRETIGLACQESPYDRIVITHGTDTMVETAQQLQAHPALAGKTIILTGAMRPYSLGHSDASFNLGSALMAVQTTSPGIYIVMNGHLFKADTVVKNRQAGLFEIR